MGGNVLCSIAEVQLQDNNNNNTNPTQDGTVRVISEAVPATCQIKINANNDKSSN